VNLEGALTWAFEFEDQPYYAGFRVLASNGIDLPVLNVFRMFSLMGGQRLDVRSTGDRGLDAILKGGVRDAPDISALAARDGERLAILAWHYHDDDLPGPDAEVELELTGLPAGGGQLLLHHYRIDQRHSNSFEAWKRMGSPQKPTPEQYAELESAGQLALLESPAWIAWRGGRLTLKFSLPRQAVSLLRLELKGAGNP
jgi:xylan 1,4-beta-xylosidase